MRPRLILVGGFFGAGKSAGIARLAELLTKQERKVGIITNDEGTELVDTTQFRAVGRRVEEVAGGNFATQFNALKAAIQRLGQTLEVILAEACGSCVNLQEDVLAPLARDKPEVQVAPLNIVVDAVRAARIFRLSSGGTFSEKLNYIYRKQIEEAETLVINKCDQVSAPDLGKLRKLLAELAPHATLLDVSARTGTGMEDWLKCVMIKPHAATAHPPLDRAVFAEAESLLGWLNCTVKVSSVRYFNAAKLLLEIATVTQSLLRQDGLEVAHLKLLLCAENESTGAAEYLSAHMVRNDLAPELGGEIREPVQRAELTLNLRAEAKPELLHAAVNHAVLEIMERSPELFARMEHCEHFSRGTRAQ